MKKVSVVTSTMINFTDNDFKGIKESTDVLAVFDAEAMTKELLIEFCKGIAERFVKRYDLLYYKQNENCFIIKIKEDAVDIALEGSPRINLPSERNRARTFIAYTLGLKYIEIHIQFHEGILLVEDSTTPDDVDSYINYYNSTKKITEDN